MYLFRWRKGGGALMHVYVYIGTHNQPFLQNHFMDVYETNDRDEVQWWFVNPGSDSPEISLVRTKSAGTNFRIRTNGRFSNPENSLIRKYWPGTNVSGLTNHHCTHSHAPVYRIFSKLHPGAVPGQGSLPKIGQWGIPSPKDFFFRLEGYSNKPNIYGRDLKAYGKKRYYFWFHSKVKFLTRLWRLFGLSHLVYFNAISIDLYVIRFFICISFVYFPCL